MRASGRGCPLNALFSPRKQAIGAAFAGAAGSYDQHAALQRRVAEDLGRRIAALTLPPLPRVLEIGCGTGFLTRALPAVGPGALALITDLAPGMVRSCQASSAGPGRVFAVMDGELPSLPDRQFDLICASLVFQWFENLPATLRRLHALLRPDGVLAFATLGPASLREWRAACATEAVPAVTPDFPAAALIAQAWPGEAHIDHTSFAMTHDSGIGFLRDLRGIGAQTRRPGAPPLPPGALRRALHRFEQDADATITYEILFACLMGAT